MERFTPFIISLVFFIFMAGPVMAKSRYKTYEVVEVTEKTIVLESSGGKKIEIDKSRRPTLKKGDKVRYEKTQDRLGTNVDKE